MPTESAFFLAGLLFLAAALGYFFARFGETDEDERAPAGTRRADYLRGLKFLLSEEPDRAVEVFTGMPEANPANLETHLALASLFRRRGELDRAIRMHESLLEREALPEPQREQVTLALAEDFLGAGLLDRAEEFYGRLRESRAHRLTALRHLLRIHEQTQDWRSAIEVCTALGRVEAGAVPPSQVAHYHCELAEQARARKDTAAAEQALAKAELCVSAMARVALVRAELARDAGDDAEAARLYSIAADREPALIAEVLPPLFVCCQRAGLMQDFDRFVERCAAAGPDQLAEVALAAVLAPELRTPALDDQLRAYLRGDPLLADLVGNQVLASESDPANLGRIRDALRKVLHRRSRHRCTRCGYQSLALQWQCPGCRSWDTVRPLHSVFGD